ncbi:MAG: glycoside hydrolase family 3 C-terminal domain-containing protein [Tetragenococcus sp.]|nr:glycoside hydrolase family 3 C-terminal domain-containing protein [Tetragenococcus sp.]
MKHDEVISQLTLEQKASLMSGKSTWETQDIEELVPSLFLSDGPHGLRKQLGESDHLGLNESVPATCFPTAATLANSWDEQIVYEVGTCLGEEAKANDVQVILGPGLNIKKNPKGGRNFEYYSEDPYLAGKMAAASIRGIQKNGTIASPKHFAVNNQEYRRMASDSIVDQRAFRELYTTNFEIAVREGNAKSIMTSYNLINGVYANENRDLLYKILREEWGFDGFVVTDWGGDNNHVEGVKNGSNLAMPGQGKNGPLEIIEAVNNGQLTEYILDERVDELLDVIFQSTATEEKSDSIDWETHHQVAKEAAMHSAVLLKNENVLPLNKEQKVAVIGDFAQKPRYQGAGSSIVNSKNLENTLDCLSNYPLNVTGFAQGYQRDGKANQGMIDEAVGLAEKNEIVLLYAGLTENLESEGMDRSSMEIPDNQQQLLKELAKTNAKIVIILAAGSAIEMPWINQADAILHGYLPGEAGASAMLEVICGNYNPSGKLNETYPESYEDVPFGEEFPEENRYAYYKDSLFVGYRYYDTAQKKTLFPFGYGLSYTSFNYQDLQVQRDGVKVTLTNIGDISGEEVVQMYVGCSQSPLLRPKKELKGFKKVQLAPKESKTVFIPFDDKTFRYYDTKQQKWEIESNTYEIFIGSHSQDVRLKDSIAISGTNTVKLSNVPEHYFNGELSLVTLQDFEQLYGKEVPKNDNDTKVIAELNRTAIIADLKNAKNPCARGVYHVLNSLLKKSQKKGEPDLNLLFIYNMPFRTMAKMTNGMVNMSMVDHILTMVNGHFFKGCYRLVKEYFKNQKQQKVRLV